ncbi:DUF4185 domain-containing protein [Flavitalea flava]
MKRSTFAAKRSNSLLFSLAGVILALIGCSGPANQTPGTEPGNGKDTVNSREGRSKTHDVLRAEPAPEWAEMLKQDSGWIGADGIYCVPMDGVEAQGQAKDKETLFWFSDDIWGRVSGDTLKGDWELAHNGVAFMKGDTPGKGKMHFYKNVDKDGHVLSAFEPHTKNAKPGDYYWLGDGFFNHALDSTIYIFGYRIKNVPDGGIYPFEDVGVSLIAIPKGSKPPFTDQRQMDAPLFVADSKGRGKVVFGSNVLTNTTGARAPKPDGYIYVYGVRGKLKELLVARVPDAKFEDFSAWRFWDGKNWQPDIDKCAALTNRVSNEMSVSFMEDGRVIAVYQLDTNSPDLMVQVGKTPEGPFALPKKIGATPEIYEDIDFYTYNAKAHPHLSKPGELLISYNVNSFDFEEDIKTHPHHLRPRFVTIKYR